MAALQEPLLQNPLPLEGMACPGGCVAGAGTLQPIKKSQAAIALQQKNSTSAHATASDYIELLPELVEEQENFKHQSEE